MGKTIEITIKNSECSLPKGKRALLAYPEPELVPCEIEEYEDEFVMRFDVEELYPFDDIKKRLPEERWRLLYNCGFLFRLRERYRFELSPDNLWFDRNLCPKVLVRDLEAGGEENGAEFATQYKALAASILYDRYSYVDYVEGGADLYRKKAVLRTMVEQEEPEKLLEFFRQQYERELEYTTEHRVMVKRSSVKAARIAVPVMAAVTIVAAGVCGWLTLFQLPLKTHLLAGQSAYLRENYIDVQNQLEGVQVGDLPYDSRYILARSIVSTESLTSAQKENILAGLTLKTEPSVFDYWIYIGRGDYPSAVDMAKRLGNNELLLFAYIKYSASVKEDTVMDGEKKEALTNDLEQKIKSLTEEIEKQKGAADESDPVQ